MKYFLRKSRPRRRRHRAFFSRRMHVNNGGTRTVSTVKPTISPFIYFGGKDPTPSAAYPRSDPPATGEPTVFSSAIRQRGGGALVGAPWGTSPHAWPGVDHVAGDRNHYALNPQTDNPQLQMVSSGGGRGRTRRRHRRPRRQRSHRQYRRTLAAGGATSTASTGVVGVRQDFLNLGSQFAFNARNAYNTLAGNSPSGPNPLPWKDQFARPA